MASVIICDEAPMANKAVLDCVEEVCRKVMRNDLLFGGKILIFLGDFRQTCPVIRGGSKAQVIDASIKSCSFWPQLRIYWLIHHCRNAEDPEFAQFVDSIGDGAGPDVPLDMLKHVSDSEDIINFVYPPHILQHPRLCLKHSILAPTNRQVDEYNDTILNRVEGDQ
jgi:ATP-dependent DNA helicase PIF1